MLLNHVVVVPCLEAVIANAIVCVSTEDGLIVAEEGERIHSHSIPVIQYRTFQITQVELSTNSARHKALAIRRKGGTSQRLLIWMWYFWVEFHLFDVEDEELWWVFGTADDEIFGIGWPGDERNAIRMTLERF